MNQFEKGRDAYKDDRLEGFCLKIRDTNDDKRLGSLILWSGEFATTQGDFPDSCLVNILSQPRKKFSGQVDTLILIQDVTNQQNLVRLRAKQKDYFS
jgi:hypothetical protein